MNNRIKLIACALASVLAMTIATPMTAHAGTLTIYNKNCTKLKGFKQVKRVTVHVYDPDTVGCTKTDVTVHKGSAKKIWLEPGSRTNPCKYKHEAKGLILGKTDVHGSKNSSVTCEKDPDKICQCTKD